MTEHKDDSAQDIQKLYNALKRNNENEATILLTHLIKIHHLSKKVVEARIRVLGAEKIASVESEMPFG